MNLELEPAKGGKKETMEADVVLVSAGEHIRSYSMHAEMDENAERANNTHRGFTTAQSRWLLF